MKKLTKLAVYLRLYTCLWIISFSSLYAQTNEAYFHREAFTLTETVASLGKYIFLNKGVGGSFEVNVSDQQIWKLDQDLNLIDSLDVSATLNIAPGHDLYCPLIKKTGDNELTGLFNERYIDYDSSGYRILRSKMHVVSVDSMLNPTSIFTFNSDSIEVLRLTEVKEIDDTLYFTGYVDEGRGANERALLVKSTKDGSWTRAKAYGPDFFQNMPLLFNGLHLHHNQLLVTFGATYGQFYAKVDKDLEMGPMIRVVDTASDRFFSGSTWFIEVPGKEPTIVGTAAEFITDPQPVGHYFTLGAVQLGPGYLDSIYNITKIDTFPAAGFNTGVYINPSIPIDGLHYRTADSVIIVKPGYQHYLGGLSDTANDMFIYNYNAVTGQRNWMRRYINGYAHSLFSAAEVLPGNRFLIALNEYNWDKYSYLNTSIHLMVLNGKGEIMSESKYPVHQNRLSLYPMPFEDELRIKGLSSAETPYRYKLLEPTGKEVASGMIDESGRISTENIPKGSYIIQILDQRGLFQTQLVIRN